MQTLEPSQVTELQLMTFDVMNPTVSMPALLFSHRVVADWLGCTCSVAWVHGDATCREVTNL